MKTFFSRIPRFFTSSSNGGVKRVPERKETVQTAVKKVVTDYKSTLKRLEDE